MAVHGSREFSGDDVGILIEIVHDFLLPKGLGALHQSPEQRRDAFFDLCSEHGMEPSRIEFFATKLDLEPSVRLDGEKG